LIFFTKKTGKIQRIQLNESAFHRQRETFEGSFTDQHINQELKVIAKIVGIKKR
jgi:hypothetical protein